jgi:hypothetical protein
MAEESFMQRVLSLLEDSSPLLEAIEKFCSHYCDEFEGILCRESSLDHIVEYPLRCKELHMQYIDLFESELGSCLNHMGYSHSKFMSLLRYSKDRGETFSNTVEALLNFDVFLQMMQDTRLRGRLLDSPRK